jgi:NAD(P)-dependent dehydrogenase (short-subunit alcohol dehydrogenase family)
MTKLDGKAAFIAGSAKGTGKAIAECFAGEAMRLRRQFLAAAQAPNAPKWPSGRKSCKCPAKDADARRPRSPRARPRRRSAGQ